MRVWLEPVTRARLLRSVSLIGVTALVSSSLGWSMLDTADDTLASATDEPLPTLTLPTVSSSSTTTSTSTTTSSSTTTTSTSTTTTTALPRCDGTRNRGRTDVGVTGRSITLGAVTVDGGIASWFLGDQTTALQAVVAGANDSGGVCGKRIELELRDSSWDPAAGYEHIQELSTEVFALVVNPDSQGLRAASDAGFLEDAGLPVIGTDGLFANQFSDPYIWPVGPSTATVGRVVAAAQHDSGLRQPSVVYENGFGFGREAADAYNDEWARRTGSDIPGYSEADGCVERFCGISPGWSGGGQPSKLRSACEEEPACDAGIVSLLPSTTLNWFHTAGGFGGVADPGAGAVAGPPVFFNQSFAQACRDDCDDLRLWTAFRPPLAPFGAEPAVGRYVDGMRAIDPDADVVNQYAESAYVGAELAVHALQRASGMPGGLTRENVAEALDTTSDWDNGLTVAPLSWSAGDHHAATALHAFDIAFNATTATTHFRHVDDSVRTDPEPGGG